jgi:Zinc carboxypeptidase
VKRLCAATMTFAAFMVCSAPAFGAPAPQNTAAERFDVYTGVLNQAQLAELAEVGVDRQELELEAVRGGAKGTVRVEAILSGRQVASLRREGVELSAKTIGGQTAAQRATALAAQGHEVFRPYSGPGGLREEFVELAADNRRITKLVSIGKSVQGKDIVALKVSEDARSDRDGKKPSVLYLGAQHAREWITPEMIRRLAHHFVDNYSTDRDIRELLEDNELWFVPVANPDGYDWTFQPGQRLWRKNLRDNNGDGLINAADGVDLNRNFAHKWGYDNEGSTPDPTDDTYRGPGPNSEAETKALDAFAKRIDFEFLVNYHSAAQLLLYGVGWQVATPTPDDVIYEAMAGDDEEPAVPGYDPDISAELYTTNGDTDTHMQRRYRTLGFTPEMSTCESASDVDPDDEWEAEDCGSVFEFPDDEELVQAEFEKNIPFAMSVAESAEDPDDPVSVVGREAEDFRVDSFDVSYGDPQTVAVWAKRALDDVRLNYRIDGGRTRTASVREWTDGERYGDENNDYYEELRGTVRGADEGDDVQVWFTGEEERRGRDRDVSSERFTYTVESDSRSDVLVIANEDYTGVNPTYPAGTNQPKYDEAHVAAIEAAGYDADVWDVDSDGIPHDLGVLSHYDAVLWYLGDNRITQDPEDFLISTPFGQLPDVGVAERQQYLTMAVRDYLNDGGKLIHAGETVQHQGFPGITEIVGGLYYALNGDDTAECVVTTVDGFFEDCLILANDFRQYWLGGFARNSVGGVNRVEGIDDPIEGFEGALGGTLSNNPIDEAGLFTPTSDVLPVAQFPQFRSWAAAGYPFPPSEGTQYAAALHADDSYTRLTRTVDLTSTTAASAPRLEFDLAFNTEEAFDHVIVEARTAGQEDWTTLPDRNGRTSTTVPAQCEAGFLLETHPFLAHYITGGNPCTNTGSSGQWNAFTGVSDGYIPASVDLSAYAGKQVEISISYVTDPSTGGAGAFVDNTRLVTSEGVRESHGFENGPGPWTVGGPPTGSPPNGTDWQIGPEVDLHAGTATRDTLMLGFGIEQLATDAQRADVVERALDDLID